MTPRPRTIQIYLPSGDPRGIRVAELTTSIVRVVEVPRSMLAQFLEMPEAGQVALYFLFGDGESQEPLVYIGQSGNVGQRLTQHNSQKDFWNKALVVVSLTNSLTPTHSLYLEWSSINLAQGIGRYVLENGKPGIKPHTPPPLQADCDEIHDTAKTLLATLGLPIFESVAAQPTDGIPVIRYYCKGADGVAGVGEYTVEGFVVLKGSKGRLNPVDSYFTHAVANADLRKKLLASGVVLEEDGALVFAKDHVFGTPSSASMLLLGRTSNGWIDWKAADGKTLKELVQKT